jgi:hypothetical protein
MKIIFYLTCLLPTIYVYVGETSFVAFPEKNNMQHKECASTFKIRHKWRQHRKCNEKFDSHQFEAIESSDGLA